MEEKVTRLRLLSFVLKEALVDIDSVCESGTLSDLDEISVSDLSLMMMFLVNISDAHSPSFPSPFLSNTWKLISY